MTTEKKQMVSIWFWVGAILCIYGLIITGSGVYYMMNAELLPEVQQSNPGLWWGIIMMVFGGVFLALGKFGKA